MSTVDRELHRGRLALLSLCVVAILISMLLDFAATPRPMLVATTALLAVAATSAFRLACLLRIRSASLEPAQHGDLLGLRIGFVILSVGSGLVSLSLGAVLISSWR